MSRLVIIIFIGQKKKKVGLLVISLTNLRKQVECTVDENHSYFHKLLQSDKLIGACLIGACDFSQVTSFVCSMHQTISK